MLEEAGTSKPTSSSSKNDKTEITTNKHFSSTSTSCSPSNNTNVKNDTAHIKTCTTSPSSPKTEQHKSKPNTKVSKQEMQVGKEENKKKQKIVTTDVQAAKREQQGNSNNSTSGATTNNKINRVPTINSEILKNEKKNKLNLKREYNTNSNTDDIHNLAKQIKIAKKVTDFEEGARDEKIQINNKPNGGKNEGGTKKVEAHPVVNNSLDVTNTQSLIEALKRIPSFYANRIIIQLVSYKL